MSRKLETQRASRQRSSGGSPEKQESPLGDLLEWGCKRLEALGPRESRSSAEQLLEEVSGLGRSQVYLEANRLVPESLAHQYRDFIEARKERIPVAYLRGKAFFFNEVLEVGPECLIPRPETEKLIEVVLSQSGFEKKDAFSFLDLGSGSGAIGIALLRLFPEARGTFVDISEAALGRTQQNLKRYGLLSRAGCVVSDMFEGFQNEEKGVWDMILSNPPYFSDEDWRDIQPEILREPRVAFDGGFEGLDFYKRLAEDQKHFLKPGGFLFLEIGASQAQKVCGLLRQTNCFETLEVFQDDSGHDRVVMARDHG